MTRFEKSLFTVDFFLLTRVFMPIAHWVDYRFHKNQYEQAAVFLSLGLTMNVAASFSVLLHTPWMGAFSCFASAGLVFVYSIWLKNMHIASRKYEQHPDQISREAYFFMILLMPPLRLVMVFAGGMIAVLPPYDGVIKIMTNPWMMVVGVSLYLAGGFPPQRKRKEKKVWAWPTLRLATTPT